MSRLIVNEIHIDCGELQPSNLSVAMSIIDPKRRTVLRRVRATSFEELESVRLPYDLETYVQQHGYYPMLKVSVHQRRLLRKSRYLGECDLSLDEVVNSMGKVRVKRAYWSDPKGQCKIDGFIDVCLFYDSRKKVLARMSKIQEEKLSVMLRFHLLSVDEISIIFSYLNIFDLIRVGAVSKEWMNLSRDPYLWIDRPVGEVEKLNSLVTSHFIKKHLYVQSVDRYDFSDPDDLRELMNGQRDWIKFNDTMRFGTVIRFAEKSYVLGFHLVTQPQILNSLSIEINLLDDDSESAEIMQYKGQVPLQFSTTGLKLRVFMELHKHEVAITKFSFCGTTERDLSILNQLPITEACLLSGPITYDTLHMLQNMYITDQLRKRYPGDDPFEINEAFAQRFWDRMVDLVEYSLENNIYVLEVARKSLTIALEVFYNRMVKEDCIPALSKVIKLLKRPGTWHSDEDSVEIVLDMVEFAVQNNEQQHIIESGGQSLLRKLVKLPSEHLQQRAITLLDKFTIANGDDLLNALPVIASSIHASSLNRALEIVQSADLSEEDLFEKEIIKNCIRTCQIAKCSSLRFIEYAIAFSQDKYTFINKLLFEVVSTGRETDLFYIIRRLSNEFLDTLTQILRNTADEVSHRRLDHTTQQKALYALVKAAIAHCGEQAIDQLCQLFHSEERTSKENYQLMKELYQAVVTTIRIVLEINPRISNQERREAMLKFLFLTSHEYHEEELVAECLKMLVDHSPSNSEVTYSIGSLLYNLSSKVEQQEQELQSLNARITEQSTELDHIRRMLSAVLHKTENT